MDGETRDRWDVDVQCRFRWDEMERPGRVLNLSEVGAFLESQNPHPVGSSMGFYFPVADQETDLVIDADVVHTGEYLIH